MPTYREEFKKLNSFINNNKLHHSILSIIIYKFLFWIKIKTNKRDGYIDYMSRGKDPAIITDMIIVLDEIIIDVQDQINLKKEQMDHFLKLHEIITLIINNIDKEIRSKPHIIYDDEQDDDNPLLNSNMILMLENLLSVDHYMDD